MGSVSLITARGCPFQCSWCSHGVFGYSHRRHSPAATAQEVQSIVDTTRVVNDQVQAGTLSVPEPRESVRGWPFIGERFYDAWLLASQNLQAAAERFAPQLRTLASNALGALAGLAGGVLQSMIAIIIAGVMLAYAE